MHTTHLRSTERIELPFAKIGDEVTCADGVFRVVGTSRIGVVSLAPMPDQAQLRRGAEAREREDLMRYLADEQIRQFEESLKG